MYKAKPSEVNMTQRQVVGNILRREIGTFSISGGIYHNRPDEHNRSTALTGFMGAASGANLYIGLEALTNGDLPRAATFGAAALVSGIWAAYSAMRSNRINEDTLKTLKSSLKLNKKYLGATDGEVEHCDEAVDVLEGLDSMKILKHYKG